MSATHCTLTSLVAALALSASSQAAVYTFDDFDNPTGPLPQAFEGTDTGYGWNEPWQVQNNSTTNYSTVATDPLFYPNANNSDNHASGGGGFLLSGRRLPTGDGSIYADAGFVSARFTAGNIDRETIYMSVLFRRDNTTSDDIGMHLGDASSGTQAANKQLGIGDFGSGDVYDLNINGTIFPTLAPVVEDVAALLVLKLDLDNDIASLYVNPLTNTEPLVADATGALPSGFGFKSLSYDGGNSTGTSSFDRVIFADTFAEAASLDIAVVPEPASVALISIGGLLLVGRRRRA